MSTDAINSFMADRKFPAGSAFSTNSSQNAFMLLGPSFRFGQRIQVLAGLKGGIFFNQSGSLTIGEPGTVRPFYRFDQGPQASYPGWSGSLSFSYPLGHGSSLMLSSEFLQSSSSILLFDPQQGIDIPMEQKRSMQVLTAGISFIKTFEKRPPQTANGDGTRDANKKKTKQAASPGIEKETVSIIDPENKRVLKTRTKSNQTNERTSTESCGPVTTKTTYPDGSAAEMTFSCPEDALHYQEKTEAIANRNAGTVTRPKQSQGATFGEKVNAGLQNAGGALSQGSARTIIGGRIVYHSGTTGGGIIPNSIVSSVSTVGGGNGGGAASASYARTGNNSQTEPMMMGSVVNLFARDAASGMPSGKRSRQAASGSNTPKYLPVFAASQQPDDLCSTCGVRVTNPTFQSNSTSGSMPVAKNNSTNGEAGVPLANNCGGPNAGLNVYLLDRNSGATLAATKTNECGEYWFANVPEGNFRVQVEGTIQTETTLPVTIEGSGKKDLAGEVVAPFQSWEHIVYNNQRGGGKASMQDMSFVVADDDGDGLADFSKFTGTFSDGSTRDLAANGSGGGSGKASMSDLSFSVSASSNSSGGGSGKASMSDLHFSLSASAKSSGGGSGKASMSDLHFTRTSGGGGYSTVATFSDGSKMDITPWVLAVEQPGVLQVSTQVADTDDDGLPDLIWSPRSNVCVNAQSANINKSSLPAELFLVSANEGGLMPLTVFDLDDDGITEVVAGNLQDPGNGGALRPGNPIGGLTIKGGRNPGGNLQSKRSNGLGEFEFTDLTPGNYLFQIETRYVVADTRDIDWRDNDSDDDGLATERRGVVKIVASQNSQSLRTIDNGDGEYATRAQDHNSTRSNKTASGIATNPYGGDDNTKAQDHNSTRSNKTASGIAPNPADSTAAKGGKLPIRWSAPEVLVNDLKAMQTTLVELDQQLSKDRVSNKSGLNTAGSRVTKLQAAINSLQKDASANNAGDAQSKTDAMDQEYKALQQSLYNLGQSYTGISNVLKTKHDTVKNSIGNTR
jgi:hypothetical protein